MANSNDDKIVSLLVQIAGQFDASAKKLGDTLEEMVEKLAFVETKQAENSARLQRVEDRQREDGIRFGTYLVDILSAVRETNKQLDTQTIIARFDERISALERAMVGSKS